MESYLRNGDIILLESERNCFLSVDPISKLAIWELSPDRENPPANTENCLWRIVPRLSYVDQEMYYATLGSAKSPADVASDIEHQAIQEKRRNEQDIKSIKSDILYGNVVQLQHVLSGMFLSCMRTPSVHDPDCFRICVAEGSAAAYLKVSPMYKIRTDGGHVILEDDVIFSSLSILQHFLSRSRRCRPLMSSHGLLYDECNLSRDRNFTKISVRLYSRVEPYSCQYLTATQGVRLFHSETNSFLQASCDLRDDVLTYDETCGAYLETIDPDVPFAHHPNALKAASLWAFETADRLSRDYIEWRKQYRIKHIPTNRFLTVLSSTAADGRNSYTLSLRKEEEQITSSSQMFTILPVELSDGYVESSDVMIQLENTAPDGTKLYVRKPDSNSTRSILFLDETRDSYDSFMLMEVKRDVVNLVQRNHTYWNVAQIYCQHFVTDRPKNAIEIAQEAYAEERKGLHRGSSMRMRSSSIGTVRSMPSKSMSIGDLSVAEGDGDMDSDGDFAVDLSDEEKEEMLLETTFMMLKEILFDVIVGDQDDSTDPFSLEGNCDEVLQNCAREQFMMEALLTVVVSPVVSERILQEDSNGQVGSLGTKEPITVKSVHMLAWNTLKHLYKNNFKSEMYFVHDITKESLIVKEVITVLDSYVKRKSDEKKALKKQLLGQVDTSDEEDSSAAMSFAMARITNQIPLRLGAAYAFTTLISNNRELLMSFVNPQRMRFFKELISEWGPDKRFLEVFRAICSCKGQALQVNQEQCLDLILSSKDDPFVIDVVRTEDVFDPSSNPLLVSKLADSTKDVDEKSTLNVMQAFAGAASEEVTVDLSEELYLGMDAVKTGFPRLYVKWTWSDDWKSGMPVLYYSPKALKLQDTKSLSDGSILVPIEALSFPLTLKERNMKSLENDEENTEFKLSVANFYHLDYELHIKEALATFSMHKVISEYFREQIRVYAEMCLDRCHRTTVKLSEIFSFNMMFSGMANTALCYGYRGAFTSLLRTLIVDQFPHLENCGSYRLPHSVNIYHRILEKIDIDDCDESLPKFSIPTAHGGAEEMYRYATPKKLELILVYCNAYLSNIHGEQCCAPSFKDKNYCTLTVLDMIDSLLSFGFYDSRKEIKAVVGPMMLLLDGRLMTETPDEKPGVGSLDYARKSVSIRAEKRYTIQENAAEIISAKFSILRILRYIKNIRGQYRLDKFLKIFAKVNSDRRKTFNSAIGPILATLADDSLSISTLANMDYTDTIFVDLMMYEDEDLFEKVLTCLIEEHEITKSLIQNCKHVYMLYDEKLDEPMNSYDELVGDLWYLRQLFEKPNVWAGGNVYDFDAQKFKEATNILVRLRKYLYKGDDTYADQDPTTRLPHGSEGLQEFLFSMNVHNILVECLDWIADDSHSDPDYVPVFSWTMMESALAADEVSPEQIVCGSLMLLCDLVCDKSRPYFSKIFTIPFIERLSEKMYLRKYIYEIVVEIYRGSVVNVLSVPSDVMELFASLLDIREYRNVAMRFFEEMLCPDEYDETPVPKNQAAVCEILLASKDTFVIDQSHVAKPISVKLGLYISYINLLSACCKDNSHNRDMTRFLFPWYTVLDRIEDVVHAICNATCPTENLFLHVALLDAYVDIFCVISLNPLSNNEEVVNSKRLLHLIQYLLALIHDEMVPGGKFTLFVEPIIRLARGYLAVTKIVDKFVDIAVKNICYRIVESCDDAIWSTTKVLCMSICDEKGLGVNKDNFKTGCLNPPVAPTRVSACSHYKSARKRLVCVYDMDRIAEHGFECAKPPPTRKVSMFVDGMDKRDIMLPALLDQPSIEINKDEKIQQFQDFIDQSDITDVAVHDAGSSENIDDAGRRGISGGLRRVDGLLTSAVSGGIGAVSGGLAGAMSGVSAVAGAAGGVLSHVEMEMGGMLGARTSRRCSEAMKDQQLQRNLKDFTKHMTNNEQIKAELVKEKLSVIEILMNAHKLTDPRDVEYQQTFADRVNRDEESTITDEPHRRKTKRKSFTNAIVSGFDGLAGALNLSSQSRRVIEVRRNVIHWNDIVRRMIRHIDYKNDRGEADSESSVCNNIIHLLNLFLEEGENDENEAFSTLENRQNNLNSLDIMALGYRLVKSTIKGPIYANALKLMTTMFLDGNTHSQQAVLDYMHSTDSNDSDGQFFKNIYDSIDQASVWVRKRQFFQSTLSLESGEQRLSASDKEEIKEICAVLSFLQGFCEGHNLAAQNCLREQPFNRRNYNIIAAANDLLEALVPRRDIYESIGILQFTVLGLLLDFLIESIQGPCSANQLLCAQKKTLEVCKQILSAKDLPYIPKQLKLSCKFKAITLLAALLECRYDDAIEKMMIVKVELYILDAFGVELREEFSRLTTLQDKKRHIDASNSFPLLKMIGHYRELDEEMAELENASNADQAMCPAIEDEDENEDDDLADYKSVATAVTHYNPMEHVDTEIADIKFAIMNLFKVTKKLEMVASQQSESLTTFKTSEKFKDDIEESKKTFESMMCEVDIFWNGKVERVIFPLPREATDLSETTKIEFMNNCDLTNREGRLKELMDMAPEFYDEMRVYNYLSRGPLYGWLLDNYFYFKMFTLVLVSLLVLSILFGHTSQSPRLSEYRNKGSEDFTIIFVLSSCICYFILFLYWFVPRIAMSAYRLRVEGPMEYDKNSNPKDRMRRILANYDWGTLVLPFVTFPFLLVVYATHYTGYLGNGEMDSSYLIEKYVVITCAIYGFWLPFAVRKAILVPNNFIEEMFCIVLDTLVDWSIIEHLGCLLLLILGYKYVYFYCLVLLDWISLSEHMKNVVRSVIRPLKSLCSVFALFIFVILIFSMIGFFVFDESYKITEEELEATGTGGVENDPAQYCSSPMSCVWTVAYGAVRAGDVAEIMDDISPDQGSHYYARLLFDMAFFVILGVLLFDMVTGIIVDTFVSLREETCEKENVIHNEVFISGITRDMCADKGVSFKDHQDIHQHTWNYIYFYAYLREADKTLLDGAEQYAWDRMQNGDASWFPRLTSSVFQGLADEKEEEDKLSELSQRLSSIESTMAEIVAKLNK
mmetsp:Transcript_17820/g.26308  ORF Transcript_17820/g.26308 Transcript_17820/m.26308 type:complete len:3025 (+) Transcript_17820:90-9164(+)